MSTAFRTKLRQLRKDRKLTQVDVAAATDLGRSTIAGIERGIDPPGRETLERLAAFYGVPIGELYDSSASSPPECGERAKDQDEAALLLFWRGLDEAAKRLFLLSLARGRDGGP